MSIWTAAVRGIYTIKSMKMNGLKKRLNNGEALIGTFLSLGNSITTEIIAQVGFDWVIIDLEHGMGSENDVLHQLQAIEHTNTSAIIRVEGFQRQRIHRVLDLGAQGIMCPRIDNAKEAALAVKAMQYPPAGLRGVAKMVRATGFGANFGEYQQKAKDELLGIIQIETEESLDHVDEIAMINGVDVLFIGPADLSMALGIFGELDHPKFLEAEKAIIDAALKAGKAIGFLLFDPAHYEKYYKKGIRFFACGTDALFLSNGAKATVQQLNEYKSKMATHKGGNGELKNIKKV